MLFRLSKKPRRVRARRREKSPDHFRRRRVRRRKYFTSCKLREPPRAQAMRSAIGQGEPMQNEVLHGNFCAKGAKMIRAADCKPSQTRTQRSGSRLRACQKYFFDTLARLFLEKEQPLQSVKKASQSSRPQARKESGSFSAAACTSPKILYSPQVWNFCAKGAKIMRAADCKPSQARTQRSGPRLRACQKTFLTRKPGHPFLGWRGLRQAASRVLTMA